MVSIKPFNYLALPCMRAEIFFKNLIIRWNYPKIWTMWLYQRAIHPKDAGGMANSVDPDLTVCELNLSSRGREIEPWSSTYLYFYRYPLPTANSSMEVINYWWKYWHLILANCLGSLSRNSMVRLSGPFWNDIDRLTGPQNNTTTNQSLREQADLGLHYCSNLSDWKLEPIRNDNPVCLASVF